MILEGKTVIVSGVGPGLGGEVARLAVRDGANVVVAARSAEKLAAAAAELDPSGARVLAVPTDIEDLAACTALVSAATDRFGAVHAVAQVAAVDTALGNLAASSDDDWRRCFDTNVVGSMNVVRAVTPALRDAGGGAVVLIGSQSAVLPPTLMPQIAYAASKGALLSAMYHLADELGPDRIRVNVVIPTWMWGPPVQMYVDWQSGERQVSPEEVMGEITANMSIPEIPADEDVAEAVIWLCSDRARMVTGQSLMVNAGELKG
jgi:NAD(P)-dependent dehydrogenase (short-subunit alcohol dehydrogenase family)